MSQNPTPRPILFSLPQELTEDELKLQARVAGRAGALQLVVMRFGEKLNVHAHYILRNSEEARDVVQEVFIKALREPRFFEPEFKMQAWLYRVTRNLCFNLVRDRRRRDVLLHGQGRSEAVEGDPIEAVFAGERQREMMEAVEELTEDHRAILMLRYYEDLSYAEIAERLDIRLGTVMSRLSRARNRLLAVMGGDAGMLEAS